jgi:diguanylate cyclase (GGDEF)-like protein
VARDLSESLRLSVENLRSASNFMVFAERITSDQFLGVTEQYFRVDPGLLIIEWQPVVNEADREAFEHNARERGQPDFRIWEPGENGEPRPALAREEHVPVYFMNARDEGSLDISTLGLDLAWSPERMESKLEARDSGRARASQLFNVVTSRLSEYQPLGFAITVPVYVGGYTPEMLEARRQSLLGYMAGVYAIDIVIESRFQEVLARGINLGVHDASHGIVQRAPGPGLQQSAAADYQAELEIELFGNTLHLQVTPTQAFINSQTYPLYWMPPASVLAFGLVTWLFLARLERGNRRLADAKAGLESRNEQLRELSQHDSLTGVLNRRAFEERARQEIERLDRHGGCLSLLMLDLDHFKAINDRWGHNAGDEVLVEFARLCTGVTRSIDILARLGGEEFTILLPQAGEEEAARFGERLRRQVEETRVQVSEPQTAISFTVSIGIVTIHEKHNIDTVLGDADKALYDAKQSGRNRVRVFRHSEMPRSDLPADP